MTFIYDRTNNQKIKAKDLRLTLLMNFTDILGKSNFICSDSKLIKKTFLTNFQVKLCGHRNSKIISRVNLKIVKFQNLQNINSLTALELKRIHITANRKLFIEKRSI